VEEEFWQPEEQKAEKYYPHRAADCGLFLPFDAEEKDEIYSVFKEK